MEVGRTYSGSSAVCYLMMGLVSPAVLLTFALLFGEESYQYWGERYHINLTNKYLFSRVVDDSLVGPLWREDTLSGNLWLGDIPVSPLAFINLAGRLFQLSPLGNESLQILLLYFVATMSMHLYLRRVLSLSLESATVAAVVYGATAFWLTSGEGNVDMAMGPAWLPLLMVFAHAIHESDGIRAFLSAAGLALAFYCYALNSSPSTLVTVCLLLVLYACVAFRSIQSIISVLVALGLGLVLYSPFLWSLAEAMRLSSRYLPEFWGLAPFDLLRFLAHGKAMLVRIVVGHNQYGIYPVVALVVALWFIVASPWNQEPRRLRVAVMFAAWLAISLLFLELFNEEINRIKTHLPFLSGWNVERFAVFTFFPVGVVFGWMVDRTLLSPSRAGSFRPAKARLAVATLGVLTGLQIGYSAYRMRLVPSSIYPQNYLIYVYLFLYASAMATLLILVYRSTYLTRNEEGRQLPRGWYVILIVLGVSLTTSVHGYRSSVLPARGGPNPTIMTYAERYAVPEELSVIKRMNVLGGRVVDLTREMPDDPWTAETESAELPLSGLRTPSGYSLLFSDRYGRLIATGVNGDDRGPFHSVVQVRARENTNYEALGLLDVRYILAYQASRIPGYRSVLQFEGVGKTLFAAEGDVGPAFVSPDVRCFPNDAEALRHIHHSSLDDLKTRAVLVSSDDGVAALCNNVQRTSSLAEASKTSIQVVRGTDHVSIAVESDTGGVLTLGDSYYPGWKVHVNGLERPLMRTFTALRGVEIGKGHQLIEYRYDPKMFWTLFRVSNTLLGLLLFTTLIAWVWHKGYIRGMVFARGGG